MTDTKELMKQALEELEEEQNSSLNLAIKEIIRVERNYYYASTTNSGRLKDIREIITKYASKIVSEEGEDAAD